MRFLKITAGSLLMALMFAGPALAEPDDFVDFSDLVTPTCTIVGLTATPPAGWFNVPIESKDASISGCQMMRVGDQEELLGTLRVLSVQLEVTEESPPWWAAIIALEQGAITKMGYVVGEVLWSRQDVPISGEGFANARAVGLSASIEGNDTPQEVHFLVFEKGPQKFIISLLTPGQDVEEGVYYNRNTADFGILIRSLKATGAG